LIEVTVFAGTAKTLYSGTNTINISSQLYYAVNRVDTSNDAKIGLDYTHTMIQGEIAIDTGWMWVNALASLGSTNSAVITHLALF